MVVVLYNMGSVAREEPEIRSSCEIAAFRSEWKPGLVRFGYQRVLLFHHYHHLLVLHLMAPKEPCAKYQYVLTSSGPKIVPVQDNVSKEEESPADYNAGGYLPVKINDLFKDGRYLVVRKLG